MRRLSFLLPPVLLCAAIPLIAYPHPQKSAPPHVPHAALHDVAVPMRDGAILRADIWLPKSTGRFPVLVYRTPYGKQNAPNEWTTFDAVVSHGYAVVIQDVRGRYASAGEFVPYQNEGHDGYDTIEWAAKQPWSDGRVGTFGLSYPGAVQWLAAVESPPHLKAMVPAMTFASPRQFFYFNGAFDGSWLEWIWMNIAPDARVRKNLPGPRTYKEARASWKKEHGRLENFLPLFGLPDLKQVTPFYYNWLSHPPASSWWDWAELRGKYARVHCAVLNFSGWYDEAYGPDGATTNFNGLLAARKNEKDPRSRMIIGPWTHGDQGNSRSGDLDFGPSAPIDYDTLIIRWMDHYVRGIDNGVGPAHEKPVRIFVMGDNFWRDEDAWPLQRATETPFYLSSGLRLTATPPSAISSSSAATSYTSFLSDPAHPLSDPYGDAYGAHDYQSFAARNDVLLFDTPPLQSDTEITGEVHAQIYLSADVPDLDLWVRLLDVYPSGAAYNLAAPGLDFLRASDHTSSVKPRLLTPGKIYRLEVGHVRTSNVFKAGHRIRIQISGAFAPHFTRNLQTGKSEIRFSQTQLGRIRIYHDAAHPSQIVLPVIPR